MEWILISIPVIALILGLLLYFDPTFDLVVRGKRRWAIIMWYSVYKDGTPNRKWKVLIKYGKK